MHSRLVGSIVAKAAEPLRAELHGLAIESHFDIEGRDVARVEFEFLGDREMAIAPCEVHLRWSLQCTRGTGPGVLRRRHPVERGVRAILLARVVDRKRERPAKLL